MDDLITWLRAQLDDDERYARVAAARGDVWGLEEPKMDGWGGDELPQAVIGGGKPLLWLNPEYASVDVGEHVARHDPARVLREVEAKRRVLDEFKAATAFSLLPDTPGGGYASALAEVVRTLALPFSDRPGYREEWKP